MLNNIMFLKLHIGWHIKNLKLYSQDVFLYVCYVLLNFT